MFNLLFKGLSAEARLDRFLSSIGKSSFSAFDILVRVTTVFKPIRGMGRDVISEGFKSFRQERGKGNARHSNGKTLTPIG